MYRLNLTILLVTVFVFSKCFAEDTTSQEPAKQNIAPAAKFDEIFRLRLKHDVAESVAIIKKPMQLPQVKSMVEKVLSTVTKDIQKLRDEQLLKVPASHDGFLAGSVSDADIDAFVNLATNLLIFSNVVLYHPDVSHDYLRKNKKQEDVTTALSLVQWAVSYCRDTGIFTNHTAADKVVGLMEQELQLVPRDENYQNPFAHRHKVEQMREEYEERQRHLVEQKRKMKKPIQYRGPRLSDEL